MQTIIYSPYLDWSLEVSKQIYSNGDWSLVLGSVQALDSSLEVCKQTNGPCLDWSLEVCNQIAPI